MTAPVALRPEFDHIPLELRTAARWVGWKYEQRNGRWTKPPTDIHTGEHASHADPATWGSFADAVAAYERGGLDGIGYVLHADDVLTGIDLDHCRDPATGQVERWARQIIARFTSYTEVSPSGTGIRILLRGVLPPGGRRKGHIEVYDELRYLTITGRHLDGTPLTVEGRQAELETWHAATFPLPVPPAPPLNSPAPEDLNDAALLERAHQAANGAKFQSLWRGAWQGAYDSQSEADLALCCHLAFWTGRNAGRIDALFRQSALMRPKWDRVAYGDGRTYGQATVARATASCAETYRVADQAAAKVAPNTAGTSAPRNSAPPASEALKLYSVHDLLALDLPELRWAVPDIVPEGLTMLIGKPKLGKSWLVLGLALAVAYGGRALGHIKVEAGDVLYLALEDGHRRLKKRLRAALGEERPPDRLTITTEWRRLDEGGLALLRGWLDKHPDARLVIIDTFVRVRGRTTRRTQLYEDDYDALVALHRLATERGVAILVIHHSRKMAGDDVLDEVSGTTGLTAVIDTALVLKRERGRADGTLWVMGRDIEEERELALKQDALAHGWVLVGDAAEYRLSQERADVLRLLARGPLRPKAMAELLGKKPEAIRFLLHKMREDDQVSVLGDGRYTRANAANAANANTETQENIGLTATPSVSGGVSDTHVTANAPPICGGGALAALAVPVATANAPVVQKSAPVLGSVPPVSGVSGVSGTAEENRGLYPCPSCGKSIPRTWGTCTSCDPAWREHRPRRESA